MTDADDVRAQLAHLNQLIQEAENQGKEASFNIKDAVNGLTFASEQLAQARVYADQKLESLDAIADQLELMLAGSLNADLIDALNRAHRARQQIKDFVDRSQYHINNIDKIRSIIRMQLGPLIDESNLTNKEIEVIIEQWSRNL